MVKRMSDRSRLSDSVKFLKNIRTSGTIAPSSKFLIERLLSPIDFNAARCIVELGPGNGCVTRALLERMHTDSVLVCIEVNTDFIYELEDLRDSRLKVLSCCASSISDALGEIGIEKADHVVSSLPLAIFQGQLRDKILNSVDSNLKYGGSYTQYQYSLNNFSDVKSVFKNVKLKFTLRNVPPAFVYQCVKS